LIATAVIFKSFTVFWGSLFTSVVVPHTLIVSIARSIAVAIFQQVIEFAILAARKGMILAWNHDVGVSRVVKLFSMRCISHFEAGRTLSAVLEANVLVVFGVQGIF
jgi:hypothetical protein